MEHGRSNNEALEKRWQKFMMSGRVEDYLRYRREREREGVNR